MDHPIVSEAEFAIMALLWIHEPHTITELTRILAADTGWTKHTVISLLRRMVQKDSIRMAMSGRTKQFYPLNVKAGMAKDQAKTLLNRLFDGKAALLMDTMVEVSGLTNEDLAELSAFIESRRGGVKYGRKISFSPSNAGDSWGIADRNISRRSPACKKTCPPKAALRRLVSGTSSYAYARCTAQPASARHICVSISTNNANLN